jgi:hypothetical protein
VFRVAALILVVAFLALGTGAVAHVHNLVHAMQDSTAHAEGHEHHATAEQVPYHPPDHHDDTNCATHAQLSLPLLGAQWVSLLVLLGIFVAFLTCLTAVPVAHQPLLRLDCRGPPAPVA